MQKVNPFALIASAFAAGANVKALGPNGEEAELKSPEDLETFLNGTAPPVERDGQEFPASAPRDPFAALASLLSGGSEQQEGPNYQVPRRRGLRRMPWQTPGCGNPECPIHGNRRVPSTPDDRGAVLTLSSAIEVEADYSEDPQAKDWIAWVRANFDVGYVRCGKCGAVTRVRYWNEFDLHDCVRKLPCLRCGALHTQVTVDGDPDNE